MAIFVLPTFNVLANVWFNQHGLNPPVGAPDVATVANLTFARKSAMAFTTGSMWLLLPRGTNIHPPGLSAINPLGDVVECPAGSGRMYNVVEVDDVGFAFTNEHRCASLEQLRFWPDPIPSGIAPPPLTGDMLLEDATNMLLEDSTNMLLE